MLITHVMITDFEWIKTPGTEKFVWEKERMERRFLAFEGFNYPSVSSQLSRYPFYWILIIDRNLPTEYRVRLDNIINENSNIFTVYIDDINDKESIDWIEEVIPQHDSKFFITSRTDNDDAICNGYIDRIHRWVEANPTIDFKVLYHPHGFVWGPSNVNHQYGSVTSKRYDNIASGMSFVCKKDTHPLCIYACRHNKVVDYINQKKLGNANEIIQRFPNKMMYIWVWHGKNQSNIRDKYPRDQRRDNNSLHHYRKRFTLNFDIIEKLTIPYT